MKTNNNRKQYRAACFYIRHIIKLDYPEKAVKLVEEFRRTYPLRTALMEELDFIVPKLSDALTDAKKANKFRNIF